jgi:hypothetical protein
MVAVRDLQSAAEQGIITGKYICLVRILTLGTSMTSTVQTIGSRAMALIKKSAVSGLWNERAGDPVFLCKKRKEKFPEPMA